MRKFLSLLITCLFAVIANAQVSVTATAGTTGPTPYSNLSAAFTAINAGTHQGAITIDISASFTDAATAVLNSNGAGTASYTSVLIRPTVDALTISYASVSGRGVIELNGADNVTIDGDNPNTAGTNRDLTITNTAANTVTYTSVIRTVTSTAITTVNDNVIRNCNINGSATGRNTSGATSTTGSEGTTYGILVGAGGSTTVTTAPSAITSVTTTMGSTQTANNLVINNNSITACARAISLNAGSVGCINTFAISNNVIGSAAAGNATTVYWQGISAQGFTAGTISGNTLQNLETYVTSTSSTNQFAAIALGTVSATGTGVVVENNIINRVANRNAGTYGATGIYVNLSSTSNSTIRNNFVSDISLVMTGGFGFSTTYMAAGIKLIGGTHYNILHNSVNLYGLLPGTAADQVLTGSFAISSTSITNVNARNNIFSNTITGGNASVAHVAVFLPSGATSSMNYTQNNNAYFVGNGTNQYLSHSGTTFSAATAYSAAGFNAGATSPATNWRSYTSTLSSAGTNDNASYALTTAAPFTSASNLHIPAGTSTILESGGAAAGVTTDIDNDARNATTPDIGADEFAGVFVDISAPAIVFTPAAANCAAGDIAVNGVVITDASGVPTAGALMPRIYYRKNGGTYVSAAGILASGTATNGTWNFTIAAADMGGLVAGDIVNYYIIAQDISGNIASNPAGVVATDVNTVTTHPAAPVINPAGAMTGTYTVGAGGNFTTLTAAANAYNVACLSGAVVLQLTDATYASETFPITFRNTAASATNTLTIRPGSGVTTTISSALNAQPLLRFTGNYITLDGSNNGTNTRDLTISNTSTNTPNVVLIGSTGTTPVTNVAVKNTTLINHTSSTALVVSDGATPGNPGYFNNVTIENNSIQRGYMGAYINAQPAAGNGSGLLVTSNALNTTGANAIVYVGIYVQGVNGGIISGNDIAHFETTSGENNRGIWLATGTTNTIVERNNIYDIRYTGTSGYGSQGVAISTGLTNSNITVRNNMIREISSDADSYVSFGATYSPVGIYAFGDQTGVNIFSNTIYLSGNTLNYSVNSYSIGIALDDNSAGNIKNNIIVNNLGRLGSTGTGAVAIAAETSASQFTSINNNSYFAGSTGSGANYIGKIGSTNYSTLATFTAAAGGNTLSVAFQPTFVSASDLHVVNTAGANWCLDGAGEHIASVTTDYDGATRNNPPDIGADEFDATGLTIVNPAAVCEPATVDLTAAAVTAGSIGGLTFTYFTDAAGTAALANPNAVAAGGTYYVKATNGSCSITRPVVVTINPAVNISGALVQPSTCATSDGSITLTLTGAAGPYTFAWTGPGVNATAQNQTGLTVGVYNVTVTAGGCSYPASFALIGPGGCNVCPVIGSLSTTPATTTCTNTNVTLTAAGLADMGSTYGITFVRSTTALADPYTGGTVITTVANGSLTGGGTGASTTTTFAAAGNYFVYAILSPVPVDPSCRPFVQSTISVNAAPVITTCPANVVVSNTAGQCGAVVNYPAAIVTGTPAPTVTYSTPSGSVFPIGTTTVTVTATNSCGTTTCSFTVRVNDTQAPVVTCPANINTTTAAGVCTAPVTFTPTVTDNCPGATVTAVPASGSNFPVGTTTVNVTARDAAGNTSTCSFTVTVTDTRLPAITAQPVNSNGCGGAGATFSVTATNAVSYQWQVNTGSGFTNIPGATGATLTLNNVTLGMSGYQYRVIVNGACTNITSNAATLTVTSAPTVSLSANTLTKIAPGQVTGLRATFTGMPGFFTWYRNNTVVRQGIQPRIDNITVDSLGTYRVMLTDVNGCTGTSADLAITADPNFQFFVYPTPNTGQFQVRFYAFTLNVKRTLHVYDSRGSRVFSREFVVTNPYEKMDVDLTKHTAGTYYVELRDGSGKLLGSAGTVIVR